LAAQVAQVVEARLADLAAREHLHLRHVGRGLEELALDADAVRDLADREAGARGAVRLGARGDHALERLQALLLALADLHLDAHGVTGAKVGERGLTDLVALDLLDHRGRLGHGWFSGNASCARWPPGASSGRPRS